METMNKEIKREFEQKIADYFDSNLLGKYEFKDAPPIKPASVKAFCYEITDTSVSAMVRFKGEVGVKYNNKVKSLLNNYMIEVKISVLSGELKDIISLHEFYVDKLGKEFLENELLGKYKFQCVITEKTKVSNISYLRIHPNAGNLITVGYEFAVKCKDLLTVGFEDDSELKKRCCYCVSVRMAVLDGKIVDTVDSVKITEKAITDDYEYDLK